MTRTRRGVFIAQPGSSVSPGNNRYESDRPHLQASLVQDPPHMDIREFNGGTAFVGSGNSDQEETLLTIDHHLSYTPEVLVYFYALTYGGSPTDPLAGLYGEGRLIYSGSAGLVSDVLYARVNRTDVKIIHQLETFFFGGPGSYTSNADQYGIRMKIYILSNDSNVIEYETKFPSPPNL